MTSLPPISSLTHSPDSTLTQALDLLFEPSPPLHKLTLPILRSTTFPTYDTLIVAVQAQLAALAASDLQDDIAKLSEILCSHPRLGEKKVDSEQSRKEQSQLQGNEEEGKKLKALNDEYEQVFPGLRYVYALYISFLLQSNVQHIKEHQSPSITDSRTTCSPSATPLSPSEHIPHPFSRYLLPQKLLTLTFHPSVFVNGRSRPVIMENMRSRIDRGDIKAERQEAIEVSPRIHLIPHATCLSASL